MIEPNREQYKELFNFLKEKGFFREFKDYEDYSKKTDRDIQIDADPKKDDFKKTLSKKEQKEFRFMFGENDD